MLPPKVVSRMLSWPLALLLPLASPLALPLLCPHPLPLREVLPLA